MYNGEKQIFITITYKSYEIINNIEVYPLDGSQAITNNAVVLPWQAKVPYILNQNHQNISNLLKTRYTTIKTRFKFIDMKSSMNNLKSSNLKSYKIK